MKRDSKGRFTPEHEDWVLMSTRCEVNCIKYSTCSCPKGSVNGEFCELPITILDHEATKREVRNSTYRMPTIDEIEWELEDGTTISHKEWKRRNRKRLEVIRGGDINE